MNVSEKQHKADHRSRPTGAAFRTFMGSHWAPRSTELPELTEAARYAATRREAVSAAFPGERLVVPAGGLKIRSNDTDYVFRPHSAFAHLTGLGVDREPDSVLVLEPVIAADGTPAGHEAVLYFLPLADRDSEEFFADSRVGEFWVGSRPTLSSAAAELGLATRHLDQFADAIGKDAGPGGLSVRMVREADREVTMLVDQVRGQVGLTQDEQATTAVQLADEAFSRALSTLRLVKDDWEVRQMEEAVAATATAFDAVVEQLPEAVRRGRGERWVEGVFGLHARHTGNGVGYDSICAAGEHATTLHWNRNTGELSRGDLLLVDAGVETDSLFTADVTRTLPVDGTFTPAQRQVYDAVLAAQEAGLAAARPGNRFKDIHAAAIKVIAEHLLAWGLLPDGVTLEQTLDAEEGQFHRRWMVHGTSHHLGIDVHDCALALREDYVEGELREGMVLTVEPGLYFKSDDLLVPEELRGIGVRIEDDVVITADGCRNLSQMLPRTAEEVESWVRSGGVRQS
ncbi:MAG: aminopeptidase P family protein [Ornithinimicrobium sp.]|uniref:aminopeptidase P family protein n=1 Tax=Ornithinimicrobium sp. TaxID=1977084 RepID=UPI0026DEF60E|nr:aminopeptidase P family protein [Ornithinimicrobium sp.]MDO5739108.1 aminopeptidase P family protein [Ornithinimicrobium sp.]